MFISSLWGCFWNSIIKVICILSTPAWVTPGLRYKYKFSFPLYEGDSVANVVYFLFARVIQKIVIYDVIYHHFPIHRGDSWEQKHPPSAGFPGGWRWSTHGNQQLAGQLPHQRRMRVANDPKAAECAHAASPRRCRCPSWLARFRMPSWPGNRRSRKRPLAMRTPELRAGDRTWYRRRSPFRLISEDADSIRYFFAIVKRQEKQVDLCFFHGWMCSSDALSGQRGHRAWQGACQTQSFCNRRTL